MTMSEDQIERGKRLRERREQLGYTTRDLAEKLNVTAATISNIESQGSMPKLELAYKLARALNKTTDWILTGENEQHTAKIPIIGNTQDSYKTLYSVDLTNINEYIDFPTSAPCRFYALKVNDDSMSPRVLPGEVIIVDPYAKPQTGEDVIVNMKNGEVMIKTLSSIRENNILLNSINSLYQRIIKKYDEIDSIHQIIAVARSTMIKKNRQYDKKDH